MSKLQTSIQRAIEKSRGNPDGSKPRRYGPSNAEVVGPSASSESEVFPVSLTANPNSAVMEENRVVAALEDHAAITAYKLLRTRILQRMRSNDWRTLVVTSCNPAEGKTLTAINLALSIARDVNQSVMLVDLDLQRFSVGKYLGLDMDADVTHGIGEYLEGKAEIPDILYRLSGTERITVIPNREPVAHSSDILSSPRMKELLRWIRQQSDHSIVIIDMPPVLACDDVVAFSPEIDAILMVVSQGQTERAALGKAMELLGDTSLIGVVLNRSDEVAGKNPYGYY